MFFLLILVCLIASCISFFFVILSSWHTSICMRLAWSIAYTAFYLFVFYSTYLDFSVKEYV